MIDRLISLLRGQPAVDPDSYDAKQIAAGALLVESCRIDASYAGVERRAIKRVLGERFALSEPDAEGLLRLAERSQSEVYSDFTFTEAVRESFSEGERVELISMLWEVALSDGELHSFEDHMIRRVAIEVGVTESEVDAARKEAAARLGLGDIQPTG
ncbi:MAG: TerB family tellurite resistance protein [Alphaproteobacteria bacterium]|nr:TerB family tellurite resistance protein [Alphaproteobacteria bacterium]